MTQDIIFICEVVLGAVFGAVLVTILGLGIYYCVRRSRRMSLLRAQSEETLALIAEKQRKLEWFTGMANLAEDEDLFGDEVTSIGSSSSRGSQASRVSRGSRR